jgi:hypothetical protein
LIHAHINFPKIIVESYLLNDLAVTDLKIVNGETVVDEDGNRFVAVYSYSIDAITFVDTEEEQKLLKAGVEVIDSLPYRPTTE